MCIFLKDLFISHHKLGINRIAHLDLSKNLLKDEGISILASIFSFNNALVSLNIASNNITSTGIEVLCHHLEKN